MTVTLDDIQERESRHVLQTYKRQPVAFVRGDVRFTDGDQAGGDQAGERT